MIDNNNEDRRVRKTKRALVEGLAEIMITTDLHHITIKELTNRVDIHRSTFYAHFEDIYSLYNYMENSVLEDLNTLINSNYSLCFSDYYSALFEYVENNKKICKLLFKNNASSNFLFRVTDVFRATCLRSWHETTAFQIDNEELDYLLRYHLNGCVSIMCKWAETDFTYPKVHMIRMINELENNMETSLEKLLKV